MCVLAQVYQRQLEYFAYPYRLLMHDRNNSYFPFYILEDSG